MLGLVQEETPMHLDTWSSRVHPDDIDACYADIQAHLEAELKRLMAKHNVPATDPDLAEN